MISKDLTQCQVFFVRQLGGEVAYDPQRHHRRSIRLRGFDYAAPGGYFVTICVQNGVALFGQVANGEMQLNAAGRTIREAWLALPARFANLQLDEFVVMPNHFHGIVVLTRASDESVQATLVTAPPVAHAEPLSGEGAPTRGAPTLFDIIGAFKSITTDAYIVGVKQHGWPRFDRRLWHRNYYEHVVRDEADLTRIRNYIRYNPANWRKDDFHIP